jgi:enoyl-CoA hydratase/carnithine racemase
LPEVKLGIIPGWGGTQRMPRLLGSGRALEFMLTGDVISAQDAERIGLVNRVYPAAQFLPETMAFAKRLAKGAPLAQRAILQATEIGLTDGYARGIEMEREQIIHLISTQDAGVGIAAFLTKQEPEFKGS